MSTELVTFDGWRIYNRKVGNETVQCVLDTDLAKRAEMSRPRDIRKLIEAAADDGDVVFALATTNALATRDGSSRQESGVGTAYYEDVSVEIGSGASRVVRQYYLDEEAAIHVTMRMKTPKAKQARRDIVAVFVKWRRGELTDNVQLTPIEQRAAVYFLPEPKAWERFIEDAFYSALQFHYKYKWKPGMKPPPQLQRAQGMLYDILVGKEEMGVLRSRDPGPRRGGKHRHSYFSTRTKETIRNDLGIVAAIAATTHTKEEFWHKLRVYFSKASLQLQFVHSNTIKALAS